MKKILVVLCMGALVLTGCSTYQYTARQTGIDRDDIQASPTLVDIKSDFNKRVEAISSWHPTKEDAMLECRYLAITNNKIDLVVDPIYKIECRNSRIRKRFKATLTGFAGYYVNGRTQREDIEAISKFSLEDIEKYLILHNPKVLKYINAKGEVVNIFHSDAPKKPCCDKPAQEPKEQPAPAPKSQSKRK